MIKDNKKENLEKQRLSKWSKFSSVFKKSSNDLNKLLVQKLDPHLVKIYGNRPRFLFLFFIVIPVLYIPVSIFAKNIDAFFNMENSNSYFHMIISLILAIFILLNAYYVRLIFKNKGNFKDIDYENAIKTSDFAQKFQKFCVPIFIGIFATIILSLNFASSIPQNYSIVVFWLNYFLIPTMVLSILVAGHMIFRESGKNFNFDLARTYLLSINSTMSDAEKLNHVIVGIENYDEYIDTKIKRRIKNLNSIIGLLIKEKELTKIIEEIREKLQGSDILLLSYLIKYSKDDDNLIKNKIEHKIKEKILIIGTISTSIVIPVITLLLRYWGILN